MKLPHLQFILATIFCICCSIGIFVIIYSALNKDTTYIETNKEEANKPTIIYFKDKRTNLCFAHIYYLGEKTTSTFCVPCDSVKNELLK
jgi:hypothetical protein